MKTTLCFLKEKILTPILLGSLLLGGLSSCEKDTSSDDDLVGNRVRCSEFEGVRRTEAVNFSIGSKVYVGGGFDGTDRLNDFWSYDATANSWTELRKINDVTDDSFDDVYDDNIKRSNATIFVMGDKAYLSSGSRSGIIASTWEYDIPGDTWIEKTGFEGTSREGLLSFTVDNRGFIVTGNNSSYRFDDLWEFYPPAEQDDDDN